MTRTAILFPGQGAQKVGMGADFIARYPAAKEMFDRADEVLGFGLSKLCLEGPDQELTLTKHCQPAIYLTSATIATVLETEGRLDRGRISYSAGLSLGEYTALYFAGAFSFEDGLSLVARRGAYMQEASDAPPSGMISLLGADREQARKIAEEAADGEVLVVANMLSPGQIVLSGAKTAVARVPDVAKANGVRRARELNVAGAFHSPLMQSAADRLTADLDAIEVTTPSIQVVSNVTGRATTDPAEIRANLAAQVVAPVLWEDGMSAMIADDVGTFIEPGPGSVLTGLLRKIDRDRTGINYDSVEDVAS